MKIECPRCRESFDVQARAVIPDNQIVYMRLTTEQDLFAADVIGKAIVNMEAIHRAVAAEIGARVAVFLKSVELKDKEITIGFQIVNAGPLKQPDTQFRIPHVP